MYEVDKLYQIKEIEVQRKAGSTIPMIIKGTSPSITIYGSESKPTAIADMVDLTPDVSPITDNLVVLDSLFRYIAFVGTTDGIEFNNIALTEIDDIS